MSRSSLLLQASRLVECEKSRRVLPISFRTSTLSKQDRLRQMGFFSFRDEQRIPILERLEVTRLTSVIDGSIPSPYQDLLRRVSIVLQGLSEHNISNVDFSYDLVSPISCWA